MSVRDHMPASCLAVLDALKAKFNVDRMIHLDCPPILKGSDPYDPEYNRAFQLRKRAADSIEIYKDAHVAK